MQLQRSLQRISPPIRLTVGILAICISGSASSQEDTSQPNVAEAPITQDAPTFQPGWALEQVQRLGHNSYRTRMAARNLLEENPRESLPVIRQMIRQVDVVAGIQLVEILSGLASHSELEVSDAAIKILIATAENATSVGRSASNSLSAIQDLQEEKASEMLVNLGAYIGPRDFNTNGRSLGNDILVRSLRIDDQFGGTARDFEWIRYLRSVKAVYLAGDKISGQAIEAVSQLKNLQIIKLKSVHITKEQLLLFQDLYALEHLELSYLDVDDSFIPCIVQLPITRSMRLYGTKVTAAGAEQLAEHFKGLEVFRGSGGFLGISSSIQPGQAQGAQVAQVTPNSAASRAGIQPNDMITAVNGVPVGNFDQLRNELGNYEAGASVNIRLIRLIFDRQLNETRQIELTVTATLQEESH